MTSVRDAHTSLTDELATLVVELCAVASPIGEERAICDAVGRRLVHTVPGAGIVRFHDSLIVRARHGSGGPRIGLVGHFDTVRTEHEGPARREGSRIYGAGAADMKSGLAIMIALVERLDLERLPCDLTLVFYEREEGPFEENRLGPILESFPELRELDLAICLEPSDNKLQLGCLGSVHATVAFLGRTSHSARPWQGENAITKAAPFLAELGARAPHEVELDGFVYREVITPTLASGGRGRNIVPDRFELNLNYRFAPGRTPREVARELEEIVAGRAEVTPTDLSPAGRPHGKHPLVQRLASSGVATVEPKLAWTDVARFDSVGVPAVNLGPGTQAQAHQKNEYTEVATLEPGYRIFESFLTSL